MSFTLLLGKIWYGTIGLEFNTGSQTWGMPLYKRFLTCLKSCYPDPHDFKQLKYFFHVPFSPVFDPSLSRLDQMKLLWSEISPDNAL
jgi:hypothetical protein